MPNKRKSRRSRGKPIRNPYVSAEGETTVDDIPGSSRPSGHSIDPVENAQRRIEDRWRVLQDQLTDAAPYIRDSYDSKASNATCDYAEVLTGNVREKESQLRDSYEALYQPSARKQHTEPRIKDKVTAYARYELAMATADWRSALVDEVVMPCEFLERYPHVRDKRISQVCQSIEWTAEADEVIRMLETHHLSVSHVDNWDTENSRKLFGTIANKWWELSIRVPTDPYALNRTDNFAHSVNTNTMYASMECWVREMPTYVLPAEQYYDVNGRGAPDQDSIGLFSKGVNLAALAVIIPWPELCDTFARSIKELADRVRLHLSWAEGQIQAQAESLLATSQPHLQDDLSHALSLAGRKLLLERCQKDLKSSQSVFWDDCYEKFRSELAAARDEVKRLSADGRDRMPRRGRSDRRRATSSPCGFLSLLRERLSIVESPESSASSSHRQRDWRDAVQQSQDIPDSAEAVTGEPVITAIINEMISVRALRPRSMPPVTRTGRGRRAEAERPGPIDTRGRSRARSSSRAFRPPLSARSEP